MEWVEELIWILTETDTYKVRREIAQNIDTRDIESTTLLVAYVWSMILSRKLTVTQIIHIQELLFSAQYFYELLWTNLEQFRNNFKAVVNSYYEDQNDTTPKCKY